MTTPFLTSDIALDEGFRAHAYQDTKGIWTIGYGHAHVDPNAVESMADARAQLADDIQTAMILLDHNIPWWRTLNDARQDVLANMVFNMGWLSADGLHGLGTFKNTIRQIQAGNFADAAKMMLQSKWATDVGKRAVRLSDQMKFGFRAGGPAPAAMSLPISAPEVATAPALNFFQRLLRRFA